MSVPIGAEGLSGLLRRLGGVDMSSFSGRLCLQKKVYLAQAFGAPIGYSFNWYVRGPYSPILTRAGYEVAERYRDSPPMRFSNDEVENRFRAAAAFMRGRTSDARWLEVVASIHFLSVCLGMKDKSSIFRTIRGKMPSVTTDELERGWNELVKAKVGVS